MGAAAAAAAAAESALEEVETSLREKRGAELVMVIGAVLDERTELLLLETAENVDAVRAGGSENDAAAAGPLRVATCRVLRSEREAEVLEFILRARIHMPQCAAMTLGMYATGESVGW